MAVGLLVSVMVGMVAASLPAGTEVLCPEGEFTSVLFPFMAQQDLTVRTVPLEALADEIRPSTGPWPSASCSRPTAGSSTSMPWWRRQRAPGRCRASVRRGRLRACFHVTTDTADVDAAVEVLRRNPA